jgi:hypothetical protein
MVYNSLDDIREGKQKLKQDINTNEEQIRTLWKSLFKPVDEGMTKRGRRWSTVINTGAGVVDGLLLGWKLYRKFKK